MPIFNVNGVVLKHLLQNIIGTKEKELFMSILKKVKPKKVKFFIQQILDTIPAKTRKNIKKKLGLSYQEYTTILRPYSWLLKNGKKQKFNYFSKKDKNSFIANISKRDSRIRISYANEKEIRKLLDKKIYSFKDMLVILNPFGLTPLTALSVFNTDMPCKVRYHIEGNIPETSITETTSTLTTAHQIPIWGLYPAKENKVLIELLDNQDTIIDSTTITISTSKLPNELEEAVRLKKKTAESSLPFVLIAGGIDIPVCVYDAEGIIRYYLSEKPKGYGIFLLSDNRFLFAERDVSRPSWGNPHANEIHEMDFLGRVYHTYYIEKGIHHNAIEKTKNGNILACASSITDGYVENGVIEIDRKTGEIVKELNLNDCFDDTYKDSTDWAHINALSYDAKDDSIIVSLRNVHSIAKINWSTQELIWILCDPRFWEKSTSMSEKLLQPIGDIKWFYQQHAVVQLSQFTNPENKQYDIMLFDNHWHKRRRVKFFDNDPLSYSSIFEINETERTVKMKSKSPCQKSIIRSNSILLPESNRLFTMCGFLEPMLNDNLGMISEMNHETSEVLNEYYIKPGFFAAYPFSLNYDNLAQPMPETTDYILNHLNPQNKLDTCPDELLHASINPEVSIKYFIKNNILYARSFDHSIEKIYFIGDTHFYEQDFTDTKQTYPKFENNKYYIVSPLYGLAADNYKIAVRYKGEYTLTKKWISITS